MGDPRDLSTDGKRKGAERFGTRVKRAEGWWVVEQYWLLGWGGGGLWLGMRGGDGGGGGRVIRPILLPTACNRIGELG